MKLKKIASLMLAGVMAVSMLAGCSNDTKPDDGEKDPVVDSSLAGQVIAALSEDTTKVVSFGSDSDLDTAVAKAIENYGVKYLNKIDAKVLNGINDDIADDDEIAFASSDTKAGAEKDAKEDSMTVVLDQKDLKDLTGVSTEYAVKVLANLIDDEIEGLKLKENSQTYTYDTDKGDFWYDFSYTGNLSVTEVKDAVTGVSSYVVVYTITRTAAEQTK